MDGYKQWTESLGNDREWKIQAFQHYFSYILYTKIAEIWGYVIPFRYDIYVILSDGIKEKQLLSAVQDIKTYSPTEIRICKGYNKTPLLSLYSCDEKIDLDTRPDEKVLVAHYDVDGITKMGLREATERIELLKENVRELGKKLGCIEHYFGGDNMGLFCSEDTAEEHILTSRELEGVKVGIGIDIKARDALRKATEALEIIRKYRGEKWKVIR